MPNLVLTKQSARLTLGASKPGMLANKPKGRPCIIIDTSGSMSAMTNTGKSRLENAQDALATVMAKYPNSKLIAFDDSPRFINNIETLTDDSGGSTFMISALKMAKSSFPPPSFVILISDGEPTEGQDRVLNFAYNYGIKIHTYSVGSGSYTDFLRRLATATGATSHVDKDTLQQLEHVVTLLLSADTASNPSSIDL